MQRLRYKYQCIKRKRTVHPPGWFQLEQHTRMMPFGLWTYGAPFPLPSRTNRGSLSPIWAKDNLKHALKNSSKPRWPVGLVTADSTEAAAPIGEEEGVNENRKKNIVLKVYQVMDWATWMEKGVHQRTPYNDWESLLTGNLHRLRNFLIVRVYINAHFWNLSCIIDWPTFPNKKLAL